MAKCHDNRRARKRRDKRFLDRVADRAAQDAARSIGKDPKTWEVKAARYRTMVIKGRRHVKLTHICSRLRLRWIWEAAAMKQLALNELENTVLTVRRIAVLERMDDEMLKSFDATFLLQTGELTWKTE